MAQFKDLFTELRRDTGLSQEDFAALFHQSGSTISSYETGRNQPSFDMLIQYADYFNVTTDYLLGRVPFDMSPSVFTDSFIDNVTIQDVISILQKLPDNRRRALLVLLGDIQLSLMAVYTYGYSVSDIAKYLQVSRQNINQIKKRAENKIRQKLT